MAQRARRRARSSAVTAALVMLAAAWTAGVSAAAPAPTFRYGAGDMERLERILRDSQVQREAAQPSWGAYAAHVVERVLRAFADWLRGVLELLGASGLDARVVAWVIAVAALVALVWALVSWVLRRREPQVGRAPTPEPSRVPGEAARLIERAEWRRELEARLARGDVPAALEALWWWLARSLSGAAVERSWTSRELLARAARLDLAEPASALDRMLYGRERPHVDDVRRLVSRLDAALP